MEAPQNYKTAGIMMLVSGILTTLASLSFIVSLIWFCIGIIWFIPLVIGVMEIAFGAMILGGGKQPMAKVISIFGIVGALLCFNVIGLVLEIVSLVLTSNEEVTAYLASPD